MISSVQERMSRVASHPIIGDVTQRVSSFVNSTEAITNNVALPIFLQILISLPLVYLHHNLFTIGFAFGFVCDKFTREVKLKVDTVYNAERTLFQKVLFFGGGTIISIYLMPNVLIIATIYYSAISGSYLYRSCAKDNQEASSQSPARQVGILEQ